MKDQACVDFLQWSLPKLRLRWAGFRNLRKQVCKRLKKRLQELNLSELATCKTHLENHPAEWQVLDALCYVTISCFYRDKTVFNILGERILPYLAEKAIESRENEIRIWSAGCCSGEEPYTLKILWKHIASPKLNTTLPIDIVATDFNPHLIKRTQKGIYPQGSCKDLPAALRDKAFKETEEGFTIREAYKPNIHFMCQDIRSQFPEGRFHLLMCRNLVFTYVDKDLQIELLNKLVQKIYPNGFLVIGSKERLPEDFASLRQDQHLPCIFQKQLFQSRTSLEFNN